MSCYRDQSKAWLAVLMAACIATSCLAGESPNDGRTVATLAETATALVAPDTLTVTLRVEVNGSKPETAQADLNLRVSKAVAKAKTVSEIKVTTGSYSVFQTSQPQPANGGPLPPPQWQAQQTISLEASRFDLVLKLAGDLQETGLLMAGISPSLSPTLRRDTENRLVGEAITKVRGQAEGVATAMGMRVEGYRSIRIDKGGATMPIFRPMMARTANAIASPTSEPADQAVSVTVGAEVVLAQQ